MWNLQSDSLAEFQHLTAAAELKREHRREGFEAGNADKILKALLENRLREYLIILCQRGIVITESLRSIRLMYGCGTNI